MCHIDIVETPHIPIHCMASTIWQFSNLECHISIDIVDITADIYDSTYICATRVDAHVCVASSYVSFDRRPPFKHFSRRFASGWYKKLILFYYYFRFFGGRYVIECNLLQSECWKNENFEEKLVSTGEGSWKKWLENSFFLFKKNTLTATNWNLQVYLHRLACFRFS